MRKVFGRVMLGLSLLFLGWFTFSLPDPLFDVSFSRVLEDRHGKLLGARIASDGQWRFPAPDTLPESFIQALVTFEDKRFWSHPGVDLLALGRALRQNLLAGRVVSGGSTLSMQVIRMARGNRRRNLWNKLLETCMALRLELGYSKEEILNLYAAHAPFGGNVVGAEAAAWRYFGKPLLRLSRAESATLAVLPNSPGLIHPGRNRQKLEEKRNRLLHRMALSYGFDDTTLELDLLEPLPGKPLPLPDLAPHLLEHVFRNHSGGRLRTTVDRSWQERLLEIGNRHHQQLQENGIHNLAVLLVDLRQREVVSYLGNAPMAGPDHEEAVDLIQAPRSTGSILKPFLYAFALQDGHLLPKSLLKDIPIIVDGFRPENYRPEFSGAVPADLALARSLNVPFVNLLQEYGVEKFHHRLVDLGLSTLRFGPDHYGLSLILGGAEATLWDLVHAYSGMAGTLLDYPRQSGKYTPGSWSEPTLLWSPSEPAHSTSWQREPLRISASACWNTFEAMQQLERPESSQGWQQFQSAFPMAWKTGTSFGFRDAWAIGITQRYAIGVWVGNADGEGRPGLVGVRSAAPVLFDLARSLPLEAGWYQPPLDDMTRIAVCRESGWRAGPYCGSDSAWVPSEGERARSCPYHEKVFLSSTGQWRIHQECEEATNPREEVFFVLPPAIEYYYQTTNPGYRRLPPFAPGCPSDSSDPPMQLIYPGHQSRILVPVDLNGKRSRTVFKAAHRLPRTPIHWHLDGQYLTTTREFHELALDPPAGVHQLTLVDNFGNRLEKTFEIVERQ